MEPIAVLVLLPIVIGIVSELIFRDTTHATLAAAIGTAIALVVCMRLLAPVRVVDMARRAARLASRDRGGAGRRPDRLRPLAGAPPEEEARRMIAHAAT